MRAKDAKIAALEKETAALRRSNGILTADKVFTCEPCRCTDAKQGETGWRPRELQAGWEVGQTNPEEAQACTG